MKFEVPFSVGTLRHAADSFRVVVGRLEKEDRPEYTEEARAHVVQFTKEIVDLKRGLTVLEGLQALREELKAEKMNGLDPYSDREGAMQYGEGFERGMENALEKLESLLLRGP